MKVELVLPKPHPAQQRVLDSNARFRVLICGRRFGKSLISQSISIEEAIYGKGVAYITPTYALGKTFFKEILLRLPISIYKKNESDLTIEFITGGTIQFFTGERLDALRGRKFHLVIIDEASFIPNLEDGWNNSIRPTLTDYKGKAIFLSTPRGKNFFYSLYLKSGEDNWDGFKYTTYDNPHIDPSEIDDARMQLPPAVFEQEYLANPMENAANPFGSQYIEACIEPLSNDKPMYYGIDLAKSVDFTVIIGLDRNGKVADFKRFQKDWAQTKSEILKIPRNIPIYIDSTGNGDPITEDLQKHFNQMHGFKFTASSKQQLMEGLVNAVHQSQVKFPKGHIKEEMDVFEYQFTSTGVRYAAPQGFHDDCVMALALANKCRNELKNAGKYRVI